MPQQSSEELLEEGKEARWLAFEANLEKQRELNNTKIKQ